MHETQQITQRLLVEKIGGDKEVEPLGVKGRNGKQKIYVGCVVAEHGDGTALSAYGERLRPVESISQAQVRPQQKGNKAV